MSERSAKARDILLVEDDEAIREMVSFALGRHDMHCRQAEDVTQAQIEIGSKAPDLILLDWMLPGMNGLQFVQRLRREAVTAGIPVIMLTAKGGEGERIAGLDAGADDYLVKPFSPRELVARINAVLRRGAQATPDGRIEAGEISIDTAAQRVHVGGEAVSLGPTEFRLLRFLAAHPDRVYSRAQLLDHVWGTGVYIDERTVDVHIRRLRKALEAHGVDGYIQTVRGAGYRLSAVGG